MGHRFNELVAFSRQEDEAAPWAILAFRRFMLP
jgi:hypothetical protein